MRRFAVALLVLASATPAMAQAWMVGSWFGTGQPGDRSSMYIDRMRKDGSWRGEYRTCVKGKATDQVQEGRWRLSGDMLMLSVETVDGAFEPRTDYYRMLAHDGRSQKYVNAASRFPYVPQRVDDKYQMPSCDLIS